MLLSSYSEEDTIVLFDLWGRNFYDSTMRSLMAKKKVSSSRRAKTEEREWQMSRKAFCMGSRSDPMQKLLMAQPSALVFETALPGQHHGGIMFITGLNGLVIIQ